MLRKVLADKIEFEPVGSGRQRGYRFRGALSLEKLIEGEAMNNTYDIGGPNGNDPTGCGLAVPFEAIALPTGRRAA